MLLCKIWFYCLLLSFSNDNNLCNLYGDVVFIILPRWKYEKEFFKSSRKIVLNTCVCQKVDKVSRSFWILLSNQLRCALDFCEFLRIYQIFENKQLLRYAQGIFFYWFYFNKYVKPRLTIYIYFKQRHVVKYQKPLWFF